MVEMEETKLIKVKSLTRRISNQQVVKKYSEFLTEEDKSKSKLTLKSLTLFFINR